MSKLRLIQPFLIRANLTFETVPLNRETFCSHLKWKAITEIPQHKVAIRGFSKSKKQLAPYSFS
jgi:hypothetical protein